METEFYDALNGIGELVCDASEETFLVFSRPIPSQDLGMIDATATSIEIEVAGRDMTIQQSPGLLKSDREEGTTGAVVWKICPLFAEFISSRNVFTECSLIGANSTIIELGCGIGGVVGLALAPKISKYLLTDQEYVMRLLRQNVAANSLSIETQSNRKKKTSTGKGASDTIRKSGSLDVLALDWETSSLQHLSSILQERLAAGRAGVDIVLSCDCVFNEALVEPFVECCTAICKLRVNTDQEPSICIIAQQLRSDLVFERWLSVMMEQFHVWRLKDNALSNELAAHPGFVVHVATLRS